LSSAKKKQGKERSEEKEKKRKEVKGDPHIKGCGSQIFKSRSRSTVKRSWSETWRDYRRL
jgi:ribosomal protein L19E